MPHIERVPILLKKSSVPGKVPLVTDLEYGEVALNYADGILRFKSADNEIVAFPQARKSLTPVWSSTLTLDLLAGRVDTVKITLLGDTAFVFTNAVPDQKFLLEITQGPGGNKAYTWPTTVRVNPVLARSFAPSVLSGLMDRVGFVFSNGHYDLVAHSLGYPTT
jgi:hypothetical protein